MTGGFTKLLRQARRDSVCMYTTFALIRLLARRGFRVPLVDMFVYRALIARLARTTLSDFLGGGGVGGGGGSSGVLVSAPLNLQPMNLPHAEPERSIVRRRRREKRSPNAEGEAVLSPDVTCVR